MGVSNYFAAQWHDLVLNAVAIPNIADDAATAPLTNLHMALHTSDPGVGGSQTTSEATYTGYARQAIARDGTRWTIADLVATLVGDEDFPKATAGTNTLTHWSIGRDLSGAGEVLYSGQILDDAGNPSSISVITNVQPRIEAGSTLTLS